MLMITFIQHLYHFLSIINSSKKKKKENQIKPLKWLLSTYLYLYVYWEIRVSNSLPHLCLVQSIASSTSSCFLTHLKGCFWKPTTALVNPPHPSPLRRSGGRRKKLVTWSLRPLPSDTATRLEAESLLVWSQARSSAQLVMSRQTRLQRGDVIGLESLTFSLPLKSASPQLTDLQTKLIITLIEYRPSFLPSMTNQPSMLIMQENHLLKTCDLIHEKT